MTARRRTELLEGLLAESDPEVSAILLTDPSDIRWLTGFSGSNGWLVVRSGSQILLTDGRYVEQAAGELAIHGSSADIEVCPTASAMIERAVATTEPGRRMWFQSAHLTVATHRSLTDRFDGELVPAPGSLAHIRRVKDDDEVGRIEAACRIADSALAGVLGMIGPGCSERDLRDELEYRMRRLGADGPSYDTIVATGPVNSAQPHHRPDSTVIREGHSVVIDVGALVEGYHSDMTRSFLVGEGDPELRRMHDVVLESHLAGLAAVRAGVPTRLVHDTCREVFAREGLDSLYVHGTGHGVGLVIHEEPFLNSSSQTILMAGEVVTVEPGLYRVGAGGARVEDLVLVTEHGCRPLNTAPKDPTCPPSPPTT